MAAPTPRTGGLEVRSSLWSCYSALPRSLRQSLARHLPTVKQTDAVFDRHDSERITLRSQSQSNASRKRVGWMAKTARSRDDGTTARLPGFLPVEGDIRMAAGGPIEFVRAVPEQDDIIVAHYLAI